MASFGARRKRSSNHGAKPLSGLRATRRTRDCNKGLSLALILCSYAYSMHSTPTFSCLDSQLSHHLIISPSFFSSSSSPTVITYLHPLRNPALVIAYAYKVLHGVVEKLERHRTDRTRTCMVRIVIQQQTILSAHPQRNTANRSNPRGKPDFLPNLHLRSATWLLSAGPTLHASRQAISRRHGAGRKEEAQASSE